MASRSVVVVLIVLASAISRCRADQVKTYFIGEAKISTESGKPIGSQVLLVEKIEDRDKSAFVETAIVVKADGAAEQYTMRMQVSGDHFSLKDDAGTVKGEGCSSAFRGNGRTGVDQSRPPMACTLMMKTFCPIQVSQWRGRKSRAPMARC